MKRLFGGTILGMSLGGSAAASSGKVFDISLIKVPPSPTDVVYLSSSEPAVGLNRKGGDIEANSQASKSSDKRTNKKVIVFKKAQHPQIYSHTQG